MKLANCKKSDFDQIAEIWYQRTNYLMEYWKNESNLDKNRIKAYKLWLIMLSRMQQVIKIAIKINTTFVKKSL
jgi:hypothetical protein